MLKRCSSSINLVSLMNVFFFFVSTQPISSWPNMKCSFYPLLPFCLCLSLSPTFLSRLIGIKKKKVTTSVLFLFSFYWNRFSAVSQRDKHFSLHRFFLVPPVYRWVYKCMRVYVLFFSRVIYEDYSLNFFTLLLVLFYNFFSFVLRETHIQW